MKTLHLLTLVYICFHSVAISAAVPLINLNGKKRGRHFNGKRYKNDYTEINEYVKTKQMDKRVNLTREEKLKIIPSYVLDLYNIISKQKKTDLMNNGDTVRSYFDSESQQNEYRFKITDIKKNEEDLMKAELRIFKLANVIYRSVSSYGQISIVDKFSGKVVSSKIMGLQNHGWISFPLTDIVSRWISNPAKNNGIKIVIKTIYGGSELVDFATKTHMRREPILLVYTKRKDTSVEKALNIDLKKLKDIVNKKGKRKRRSLNRHKSNDSNSECRTASLKVPASVISWEKLLIPTNYHIDQCVGTCHALARTNNKQGTSHAVIQALYASINEDTNFPCCSPTRFENETAVMYENNEVIKVLILEEFRVQECGCL